MDKRFKQLPQLMRDAIEILHELHSTPDALALPAVLGVANLAAMPHYRVDTILFSPVPIALYLLNMSPTGMRKTTVYKEVSVGIERYERARWQQLGNEPLRHELDEKVFKKKMARYVKDQEENGAFGSVPLPDPVKPIETTNYRIQKATLNGIIDQLKSQPFVGLFSSEAGEFFNSHSFQGGKDALSKSTEMSAALTSMWDGSTITRQTGMDSTKLNNRAVNMMFFLQEETVRAFLNNPMFSAQGFVHRILITQSERVEPADIDLSAEGIERIAQLRQRLEPFHARIEQVISQRLRMRHHDVMTVLKDDYFELDPRVLQLTDDARILATNYYNTTKNFSAGRLSNWSGFAERLLEHLLRIAATLTAFEQRERVAAEDIVAAMDLMDYFIEQRLGLELGVTTRMANQVLSRDRLLAWIRQNQFRGTASELRQRVRWFGALSTTERAEILEELVTDGDAFVRVTTGTNHKTRTEYSWQDE